MVPALLKKPAMLHAYTYVKNNPVNFVDPKGLLPGKDTGNLCIEKLKQRINNGACPNEEDCTICCADLSDYDTPIFLVCESLCIGWLKYREKSGKCCK